MSRHSRIVGTISSASDFSDVETQTVDEISFDWPRPEIMQSNLRLKRIIMV